MLILFLVATVIYIAIPAYAATSPSWEIGSFAQGFVPQPLGSFAVDKGAFFDIYYNYDSFTPVQISDIYSNMTDAYMGVVNFYGDYLYHTKVILASSHYEYKEILQDSNISELETSYGYGDGDKGTILIKAPALVPDFKSEIAMDMARISIRSNLTNSKYDIPLWFSEGLAMYVSGQLDQQTSTIVDNRYRSGKLMTVDQMDLFEQRASYPQTDIIDLAAAEAQSGMVIQYIGQQYGNQSLLDIMKSFDTNKNIDSAFVNVTQKTPDAINADWQDTIATDVDLRDGNTLNQHVRGYVTDTRGSPIAYQTIVFSSLRNDSPVVYGKLYQGETDATGYYDVNVTYGLMEVNVDRIGYPLWNDNISVNRKEYKNYNVTLNSSTIESLITQKANTENARELMYIVLGAFNLLAIIVILIILRKTKK
jgi:hypothetical protein